jgi:hypothetical protein
LVHAALLDGGSNQIALRRRGAIGLSLLQEEA